MATGASITLCLKRAQVAIALGGFEKQVQGRIALSHTNCWCLQPVSWTTRMAVHGVQGKGAARQLSNILVAAVSQTVACLAS